MSTRLAWATIRNLAGIRQSAFARAFDPNGTRWGEAEHLQATAIDYLARLSGTDYRVPRPGSAEEKAAIERANRITSQRARGRAAFDARQRRQLEGSAG